MSSALCSFLHFVAAFGLVASLVVEWLTFNESLTYREARLLQICDRWYGVFALLVLAVGFLRVYYFEKGSEYYFANPFFLAKLGAFTAIGLLSIYPTIRFIKWTPQMRGSKAPVVPLTEYKAINTVLRLEIILLFALILCASMMAHGIGT